ncbi:MAG: hypothetical protein MUC56_12265 [Thermoanaerobaculales bacterium]|jgi:hypothetical protein|nr:hypothetical protein [Thermoanaerobaculales bacterium]
MELSTELWVKGGLSLVALLLVIWRHRRPGGLKEHQAGQLLGVMAVVAVVAYTNFGHFHGVSMVHHWEQFHYFLGSKYFPEVGYDGIYVASLAAERELGLGHAPQPIMRDLRTNEVVPIRSLVNHMTEVRARFSDERWRLFSADVRYFLERNQYGYITSIRRDHGYNPTPTWTFSARLFSAWPAASDRSLTALAWIDTALVGLMFIAIFRSFGTRVGCLAVIVFGLGYPWRWDWVGGAFLRQDWLAAVGVAVCLLKRGRFALAGGLIAYACMVRVFPGGFLVGPAVVFVRHLVDGRPTAWFRRLATGFVVGVLLCLAAGSLVGRGPSAWLDFKWNLGKHHGTWLTNNVGLKNLMLYDRATVRREDVDFTLPEPWIRWQAKMNRLQDERRPLLLLASAAFLAVVAAASWRLEVWKAAILGMVVAFAAVVLTCYYWVMLLLVPLGHGRWGPTTAWLGVNTGLFALHLATRDALSFELLYGLLSWALALFFLAWMAPDAWRTATDLRQRFRPKKAGDRGA